MTEATRSFLFAVSPELERWAADLDCPGLTVQPARIQELARQLAKAQAALALKRRSALAWVLFMGGTGTGKSTLFNAFCAAPLSAAGVERPKTQGPIAFAPRAAALAELFGGDPPRPEPVPGAQPLMAAGSIGRLTVIEHQRPDWQHLVAVDTPDLDSVATANREAAEDLYLLADLVVFVSSQEKYADEVPCEFLGRILADRKPLYLVLNKAQPDFSAADLVRPLQAQGIGPAIERVRLIPFAPYRPEQWIAEHPSFLSLRRDLLDALNPTGLAARRQGELARRSAALEDQAARLRRLLSLEQSAAADWLGRLEELHRQAGRRLIDDQQQRFAAESRRYLQAEIRRLFSRYDLLAGPRRLLREVLLTPLRFIGLVGETPIADGGEVLRRLRDQLDLTPIRHAVAAFNRAVLEQLSPSDKNAPLYADLRRPAVPLTDAEVRDLFWAEQERLMHWLELTFRDLAAGISKGKQWGIYSTSILWGLLILVFETTLGGGFTVIDAALDSALAPFVTKGAVELFAYQEIQRVSRDLAVRHRQVLTGVLETQKNRYAELVRRRSAECEPGRARLAPQALGAGAAAES